MPFVVSAGFLHFSVFCALWLCLKPFVYIGFGVLSGFGSAEVLGAAGGAASCREGCCPVFLCVLG